MKKRLLFALMAMATAVSGFALSEGEFVYTPQGRFQITGANLNANSAFQDMSGWTVVSAAGASLSDKFNTNANGYADGMNSVQSLDATAGEGMYYQFVPTDAGGSYVVSFKMKGAALDNIRPRIPGDGYKKESNLVVVAGKTDAEYVHPLAGEDVVICNTSEELTEQWQTFNYAIVGDGTPRTYFIAFTCMSTTIEIADLQIAPAMQFADLRKRDAMLEKMKTYRDCYKWADGVLDEYAVNETIEALEAIGNESGQPELDEVLATANEVLAEFLDKNMDDFLSDNTDNYLGIKTTSGNTQKATKYGQWNCIDRGFWNSGAYPDLGHYGGNNGWAYNNPDNAMGVYQQMTLEPGSYVFGIEGAAALREDATSSSWTINEGWNPAYGVAYIVKVNEGADPDTIATVTKDMEALDYVLFDQDHANYTPFLITAQVTESGTYEIGFKAYCKDLYKSLKNGSVTYVRNASFLSKNDNKYNKREMSYEADVREQITTGRDALTKAAEYLASEDYYWGKADLQACVDTIEAKVAKYEAYSQDDIIATYDRDVYVKADRTKTAEAGLLVYEVYVEAVRDILAANNRFVAVNDTLNSMQAIIDNAETTIALRIYDTATGKAALQAAIDNAKAVQAQMKASQYSEENAATIVATNAALNDAITLFTTTIPAENIASIVDIDFEKDAELDITDFTYSIPGNKGTMKLTAFAESGASDSHEFEKGFWSNGEQLWKGYLRVGNGTGTVEFDPTVDGTTMGTNILKVACDFYIQGLNNCSLGFYLKYVNEEGQDTDVFGMYRNYYAPSTTTNTCGVDEAMIWAKSGSDYNNASPADAVDTVTAHPLQKTHFEVIMDFGKKTQYCTVSSPNGSTTSAEVALEAIPTKFILQCNYNVNDRRAWFDNLKIDRITAGEVVGIATVKAAQQADGAIYNLAGQKVSKSYKGIVIINGKKTIQK